MTRPIVDPGQCWTRLFRYSHRIKPVQRDADLSSLHTQGHTALPCGAGHSYGDVGLNDGGILLDTAALNDIFEFDAEQGRIRCGAGTRIGAVLDAIVPAGWFLPVCPSTRQVTLGGAVALDVHGRNHFMAGTIGRHVTRLELVRSDGTRRVCSPTENAQWFNMTVGGLGLTGLVTWVELKLRRLPAQWVQVQTLKFRDLDEMLRLNERSKGNFEHVTAWFDLTRSWPKIRGMIVCGNHATSEQARHTTQSFVDHEPRRMGFDLPSWVLNRYSVRWFNRAYAMRPVREQSLAHYVPFLFQLDQLQDWNRLFGRRGFRQYQFVVPEGCEAELARILETICRSGRTCFLAILKTFGRHDSPGVMSFPMPGLSMALDFLNEGDATVKLFHQLDEIVGQAGGRVYLAKDAVMQPDVFRKYYPRWRELQVMKDPCFSSSMWRRLTQP